MQNHHNDNAFPVQVVLYDGMLVSEFALLLLTACPYLILSMQTILKNNPGHYDLESCFCGFH